ncbi:hypothetical protein NDU88_004274 [Pleurodeles waltl]|uniref:Uncharacterized protein n=1 Tax=Pleurodeles waltl TaxID=8319 RepID=A0AAV7QHW6_PLEWA|nr:hypothetical protein NDU88_004274 [Pleurodeles waltl]
MRPTPAGAKKCPLGACSNTRTPARAGRASPRRPDASRARLCNSPKRPVRSQSPDTNRGTGPSLDSPSRGERYLRRSVSINDERSPSSGGASHKGGQLAGRLAPPPLKEGIYADDFTLLQDGCRSRMVICVNAATRHRYIAFNGAYATDMTLSGD